MKILIQSFFITVVVAGFLSAANAQEVFTLEPFDCPVCPTVATEPCVPTDPVAPPTSSNITTSDLFSVDFEDMVGVEYITFGQPFKKGDIPAGHTIENVQIDEKATFSDGSLRFGVISMITQNPTESFNVIPTPFLQPPIPFYDLSTIDIQITAGGQTIQIDTSSYTQWLDGHIASEFRFEQEIPNTQLVAKVNVRLYAGSSNYRADVVIENSYTFEADPSNITYDAEIKIGGVVKYSKLALNHYHHAKWRKVLWSGIAPTVHIKHDIDYLLRTKAVANYDKTAIASDPAIASKYTRWLNSNHEPMGISYVQPQMALSGGRNDIGPLPGWATTYLLSQDKRAKEIMLSIGDLSGSYPIHYKDKLTNKPALITSYPNISLYFQTKHSGPNALPVCDASGSCSVPFTFDKAHQPSFAFLPYLVTGDQYYLEELQYWANVNHLSLPDSFRDNEKGLMHRMQIRGMAWSMRTLAQAAAFTPDSDTALKTYFATMIENNRANFETLLVGDVDNKLGVNPLGYGIPYNGFRGLSVWMDGFFTWSMAHIVDLDYPAFDNLFAFKAQLPINMMTDPEACWLLASNYFLNVRSLADSSPFSYTPTNQPVDYKMYDTLKEAYENSIPSQALGTACNSQAMVDAYTLAGNSVNPRDKIIKRYRMSGWPGVSGQPALLGPALAVSVDLTGNIAAWNTYQSRINKANFNGAAMWAILPRLVQP